MRLLLLACCALSLAACDTAGPDSSTPTTANLAPIESCRWDSENGQSHYYRMVNGTEYEISSNAYYTLCGR